jgi:hypothetical protein
VPGVYAVQVNEELTLVNDDQRVKTIDDMGDENEE